jgi:hypothetical protein
MEPVWQPMIRGGSISRYSCVAPTDVCVKPRAVERGSLPDDALLHHTPRVEQGRAATLLGWFLAERGMSTDPGTIRADMPQPQNRPNDPCAVEPRRSACDVKWKPMPQQPASR